ncbi:hypothetical protein Taro_030170, partial [Colocasia esculenta]|nr:hypothetical protein [Colocasia esculenta]
HQKTAWNWNPIFVVACLPPVPCPFPLPLRGSPHAKVVVTKKRNQQTVFLRAAFSRTAASILPCVRPFRDRCAEVLISSSRSALEERREQGVM